MKLFLKKILLFTSVIWIFILTFIIGYVYFDPFKILWKYDNFSEPKNSLNRDYVSTETYFNNFDKYKYNSFIFGSSRTLAFDPNHWKKYLKKTDSPFLFDASTESIFGIYHKIKLIDSLNKPLNNALVVLCRDVTFATEKNSKGHLFIKDPRISGESKFEFQKNFIMGYFSPKFLIGYYTSILLGKNKAIFKSVLEQRKISVDNITNQIKIIDQEDLITKNPVKYYKDMKSVFYYRNEEKINDKVQISEKQKFMLEEIKRIFVKNKTNYKIIISPLYEQTKFHKEDLKILNTIFYKNIYDFSGKNNFTDLYKNYYEQSHYRPFVGDKILQKIYLK